MTTYRQILVLFIGCLGLCATEARGEANGARDHIEAGKQLLRQENYQGALEAFETSYAIEPKTWLLFNIGMCQKALHQYADAIATFNRYLRLEKKTEKANFNTLELALQAIDELEKMVGKVKIVEAPPGADVFIDGLAVTKTPLSAPLVLDPGRHALKIIKPGFQGLEIDVIVASGAEVEVRGVLERPKAEIRIECAGPDKKVFIDDEQVGECPYAGQIDPGAHHVKVVAPGKKAFESPIDAAAGSTIVMAVELTADALFAPPTFMQQSPLGQEDDAATGPPLRVLGFVAEGLGVAMAAVGGIMTFKWYDQYDAVKIASDRTDAAYSPDNYYGDDDTPGWRELNEQYKDEVDKADGFKAAAIAGFAIGGTLMAAGGVLLILDAVKHDASASAAVLPGPNGITVIF